MKGGRKESQRGQIFSLDLLFALIPLVLLLGYSLSMAENIRAKSVEISREEELRRLANDVIDVLVKTPGFPADWEIHDNATLATMSVIPGLSRLTSFEQNFTDTHYLDYYKIAKLDLVLDDIARLLGIGAPDSKARVFELRLETTVGEENFSFRWKYPQDVNFSDCRTVVRAERLAAIELVKIVSLMRNVSHTNPVYPGEDCCGSSEELKRGKGRSATGRPKVWCTDFYVEDWEFDLFDFYLYHVVNCTTEGAINVLRSAGYIIHYPDVSSSNCSDWLVYPNSNCEETLCGKIIDQYGYCTGKFGYDIPKEAIEDYGSSALAVIKLDPSETSTEFVSAYDLGLPTLSTGCNALIYRLVADPKCNSNIYVLRVFSGDTEHVDPRYARLGPVKVILRVGG